jgi:hypothetical protein
LPMYAGSQNETAKAGQHQAVPTSMLFEHKLFLIRIVSLCPER